MSVIHHIELAVSSTLQVNAFYRAVLEGVGFRRVGDRAFVKEDVLILLPDPDDDTPHRHGQRGLHHLAFAVDSREAVDRFYKEVLVDLDGVTIEDPPCDCDYGYDEYYATYFFDPDGIKLEVVYAAPPNSDRFPVGSR